MYGTAEYPFYAKVTALSADSATVRSLYLDDPVTCDIGIPIARTFVVSKAEATRTRSHELLRQAARTESAARSWHNQVVGFEGRLALLQLENRVVLVEPSRFTPVAPAVALLLLRVPLHASISRDQLHDMQSKILDRILGGSTGTPATNVIPAALDGLVEAHDMPDENTICRWIIPRTGEQCSFRLQHAVDYAFVVDGSQTAPRELRLAVGASFCREPPIGHSSAANEDPRIQDPSTPRSTTSIEQASSRRAGLPTRPTSTSPMESDSRVEPNRNTYNAYHHEIPPPVVSGISSASNTQPLDARIIDVLLNQPDMLARFLQVITPANATQSIASAPSAEPPRRTSKYAFVPTAVQVSVHNSITAAEHRGKAPAVFVETMIYSTPVRFQPHPGVIIRLFDFQFGSLLILHFTPFGVNQRMAWLNTGGVNMQNVSAGVAPPRSTPARSMGDRVDAARMLRRYGQEFFPQPVRDVLEDLLDFLQQLDGWHSWVVTDLPHLVYWVNSVLEPSRSFVHASAGYINDSSLRTVARLSLNDGELQNVMHALSRRSTQGSQQQGNQSQQQS